MHYYYSTEYYHTYQQLTYETIINDITIITRYYRTEVHYKVKLYNIINQ